MKQNTHESKKFLNLISSLIYGKFCPRRKVTVYEDRWLCHDFEIPCENTEINIGVALMVDSLVAVIRFRDVASNKR